MYIRQVVVENLKGLKRLEFDFERSSTGGYQGWTVVTGDNASGKTALLKAIALALVGPDIARSLQPSLRGWIRHGEEKATIAVEIAPSEQDRFAKGGRRVDKSFWSELLLVKNGGPEVSLKPDNQRKGNKKGPLNGPWAENTSGWLAAGYGPFRRLYGASPDAQRLMSGPSRISRFATMFREDATLGECEIWLKSLSHKTLEEKPREKQLLSQILDLLNSDFLRSGLRVERVDSDGLWLRDGRNALLPLADMSEGYRAALAMLVDIVRHVADVYGGDRLLTERGGQIFVEHPGVVLIDEVDSHLHPEWQRKIGEWLKSHFPAIQFIVTTHSPLICQAADPGGLFHLPSPENDRAPFKLSDEDYQKVISSKSDSILLSPAFGMEQTRSPRAVKARERHASLKAKSLVAPLTEAEQREKAQLELFTDRD